MRLPLLCLVSLLPMVNALFFGCGCRQCACSGSSYGYGYQQASYPSTYGYGYQQQASYPSSYSSFSPYPPGPISGYILRPVGPAQISGYAVAGGYSGGGTPVIHSRHGQIGYVQSPYGSLPNGPYYWQPSAGAPYERVSVGGLLL
ncbi:hypothetical protein ANCCAN_21342 [Ancylostoma caninum]|uniref:Uncharacterized protein n=1 Tax=Ancylostoma caninum TaxID=29170 RepID=A0A368FP91_ANCCA|nr:hypothetical protein ANCCAN_21342 [Ancylostoma caninum]